MSFKYNKRHDAVLTHKIEKLLSEYPNGILPITQVGEPVLRQKTVDFKGQLDRKLLLKFLDAMKKTMREAPGVGLAAPQIGLNLNLAVLEDTSVPESFNPEEEDDERETCHLPFFTIINPAYAPTDSKDNRILNFYEGCLSFSGYYAIRPRLREILAKWTDENGRDHQEILKGWPARIFQHETDHLSGEIYIDRAYIRSLTTVRNLQELEFDDAEYVSKLLEFELEPNA
ncbi:MAG: peptide deformylase [Candidatus Ancillula trichonymphae]|jgi:peptide deformylase|nr:peptide deformylase [Candidatus Ancillula trichonymphae]